MGINARTLRLRKALRCQVQLFGFENSASARSGERRSRTKFGAQIKFYAKKYFSLLPRLANAVASRHALPSSSRQSRGNFHYQNSRWYGKTKQGQYMTEEQAKEDGNRPARSSE